MSMARPGKNQGDDVNKSEQACSTRLEDDRSSVASRLDSNDDVDKCERTCSARCVFSRLDSNVERGDDVDECERTCSARCVFSRLDSTVERRTLSSGDSAR